MKRKGDGLAASGLVLAQLRLGGEGTVGPAPGGPGAGGSGAYFQLISLNRTSSSGVGVKDTSWPIT